MKYIHIFLFLICSVSLFAQRIQFNSKQSFVDSTRLVSDSILVYYQNGSIVKQDTLRGLGEPFSLISASITGDYSKTLQITSSDGTISSNFETYPKYLVNTRISYDGSTNVVSQFKVPASLDNCTILDINVYLTDENTTFFGTKDTVIFKLANITINEPLGYSWSQIGISGDNAQTNKVAQGSSELIRLGTSPYSYPIQEDEIYAVIIDQYTNGTYSTNWSDIQYSDVYVTYNLGCFPLSGASLPGKYAADTNQIAIIVPTYIDTIVTDNTLLYTEISTDTVSLKVDTTVIATVSSITDSITNRGFLTTEIDGSITNEIQDISTDGSAGNITISSGSTLNLNVNDADASATNELQTISKAGQDITLSNGGGTVRDSILTEAQVDAFVANNGYLTAEVDGSVTNEIQDISTNGTSGNITISDGSTLTLNVDDADASTTNELQTLSISNDTISLTNGGFVKISSGLWKNSTDYVNLIDSLTPIKISNVQDDSINISDNISGGIVYPLFGSTIPVKSGMLFYDPADYLSVTVAPPNVGTLVGSKGVLKYVSPGWTEFNQQYSSYDFETITSKWYVDNAIQQAKNAILFNDLVQETGIVLTTVGSTREISADTTVLVTTAALNDSIYNELLSYPTYANVNTLLNKYDYLTDIIGYNWITYNDYQNFSMDSLNANIVRISPLQGYLPADIGYFNFDYLTTVHELTFNRSGDVGERYVILGDSVNQASGNLYGEIPIYVDSVTITGSGYNIQQLFPSQGEPVPTYIDTIITDNTLLYTEINTANVSLKVDTNIIATTKALNDSLANFTGGAGTVGVFQQIFTANGIDSTYTVTENNGILPPEENVIILQNGVVLDKGFFSIADSVITLNFLPVLDDRITVIFFLSGFTIEQPASDVYVTLDSAQTIIGEKTFTANTVFDDSTLVIDAVNNRIGIGTTTPDALLTLNGGTLKSTTNGDKIEFYEDDVPESDAYFKVGNATGFANLFRPVFVLKGNTQDGNYSNGFVFDAISDSLTQGPVVEFMSRANNTTVTNRPLFRFANYYSGTNGSALEILANGNVGIGTQSPTAKLQVFQTAGVGNSKIAFATTTGNVSNEYGNIQILMGYDGGLNYAHAIKTRHNSGGPSSNAIDFFLWQHGDILSTPAGKHVMTLEGTGNVGIGTTSPNSTLEIRNDIDGYNRVTIYNADTGPSAGSLLRLANTLNAGGDLKIGFESFIGGLDWVIGLDRTNNAFRIAGGIDNPGLNLLTNTKFSVLANGNVGIGTTAPAYPLDVNGDVNSEIKYIKLTKTTDPQLTQGVATNPTWETQEVYDSDVFTHTPGGAAVGVKKAGVYMIIANINYFSTGADRSTIRTQFVAGGIVQGPSSAETYIRNNSGNSYANGRIETIVSLSAGDTIYVNIYPRVIASTALTYIDGSKSEFLIYRMGY